jgi:hypothetical protein
MKTSNDRDYPKVIRLSKAGGIWADRGEVRTRCCLGAAFRSATILAVNKIPDIVRLTGNGIL